ncbi:hypothetical protein G7015_09585 [Pseudomonas kunmingensis]|uniref:hypothetical protein n=1 Tax=Stutzerimonas kunmingensis TaxID=1211807 RepID=UPI0015E40D7A|nr:hypothetical protein [Stutzerimonas kunmingensis]MBA1238725.1 hypothetical protein [Stutzerimonas kunmingensis]
MTIQNGARAPRGSACLQKVEALMFTDRQVDLIRTAGAAYYRLFEIRGTSPEWAPAHRAWCVAAENLAVAIVKQMEVRQ